MPEMKPPTIDEIVARGARALCLLMVCFALSRGQVVTAQTNTTLPCLTNALQIRELDPLLAQTGIPVRLRGVVTYYDVPLNNLFLQDASAGIFVLPDAGTSNSAVMAGQEIELEGVSGKGDYAPIIKASSIRVLGEGKLPVPRQVTFDEMATGFEDSQWIEVRGVVRSATVADGRKYLNVFMNGQRLTASIKDLKDSEAEQLMNATVRLRGVCYSRFNQRRQLRAPWLAVSSFADVLVEQTPQGEPQEVSLASLSQFNSQGYYGRRVKVSGVVTLRKADGSLYIQNDGNGLWVRTDSPVKFTPGDRVRASGYSAIGQYTPILEDASVVKFGKGNMPAPQPAEMDILLYSPDDYEGVLVRVEARLVNFVEGVERQTLVLQSSNSIFTAYLENTQAEERLKPLKIGSKLAVTGVFVAQSPGKWIPHHSPSRKPTDSYSTYSQPESVQILLRSFADITVLHEPPWWTLSHLLWTIGIMGLILLAGLTWAVVLRRRVLQQTLIIQQKVRREGIMEERDRIAREFHDTLEQELAAITIQLDAVEARFHEEPQTARRMLGLARNMSRRSLSEARRSVWDLRSHLLENSNLPTALTEMAAPLSLSSGVEITVKSTGTTQKLPAITEHNLLRITQEALVNALKHSHPKKIAVGLNYESNQIQLRIYDDGAGFEAGTVGSVSGGHFGLLDMRERAEKIGGHLCLNSRPGSGTEIIIIVGSSSATEEEKELPNKNAAKNGHG